MSKVAEMLGETEMVTLNPIRVETALPRFPVHRLAKQGEISINIEEKNEFGEVSTKWEVDFVGKFKQPGPLAYKLDTIIINRRIEEAARPIPRIVRLGSLSEICRELGQADSGKNTNHLKTALKQNASAFITAKIQYRLADGTEETFEHYFNRYSVVLKGEKLPDGTKADCVFIILTDVYARVINTAVTRPLDYEYIRVLPPAAQRFYELISFQMYAAIKNDRDRAKILYSELCRYAPLVRQSDWNTVRPQLARIHAPHKTSGYIAKIDSHAIVDDAGKPDWVLLYQPGPKARAEFRTFAKRGGPALTEKESPSLQQLLQPPALPDPQSERSVSLVAELVRHGVTENVAVGLVEQYPERVEAQMDILSGLPKKKREKIDDPAAWLVVAIRSNNAPPKNHLSKAERGQQAEIALQRQQAKSEQQLREQQADAQNRKQKELVIDFWDGLSKEQKAEHEAAAIAQASAEELKLIEPGPMKRFGMTALRNTYARKLLQAQGKLPASEA